MSSGDRGICPDVPYADGRREGHACGEFSRARSRDAHTYHISLLEQTEHNAFLRPPAPPPREHHCCQRCWLCDGPMEDWAAKLQPSAEILPRARFGAYLRAIPPSHRVGDYVHCTGRIINIFFKRLLPMSEVYHLFDCSLPTILKPLEDVHFGPRFPPLRPPPSPLHCLSCRTC